MAKPKNVILKDKFPSGMQNIQNWIRKISSSRGRQRSTHKLKSTNSLLDRYRISLDYFRSPK